MKKDNPSTASDGVSISICSKEALERLLDGNEEVRVGIRESILKKYVNSNIKPVFDQESRQYFGESLRKEMRKEIRGLFRDENTRSLVKELIITEFEKVTNEILGEMVEERIKELIQAKLQRIKL